VINPDSPDGDTVLDQVDALDDQTTQSVVAPLLEKTLFPKDTQVVDETLAGDGADAASPSLDDGAADAQAGDPT
jgi:hypothetical protein